MIEADYNICYCNHMIVTSKINSVYYESLCLK